MKTIALAPVAAAFVAAMLAGCNLAPASAPVVPTAAPQLAAGAYLNITGPGGYRVLTLTAWNKADIDHVTLSLLKDGGSGYQSTGATKTVANANLGSAINFTNLKFGTNYKVIAKAYADAAETNEIDNIASTGSDANCSATFTTPALVTSANGDSVNDTTIALSIPVRLKDKTFAGTASGSTGVGVTNGTIVNTTAAETF